MPTEQIEISGYAEIRKYLAEGAVFVEIANEAFAGHPKVVVHNVRKSKGFMQIETLEGWITGPFNRFWIERTKR